MFNQTEQFNQFYTSPSSPSSPNSSISSFGSNGYSYYNYSPYYSNGMCQNMNYHYYNYNNSQAYYGYYSPASFFEQSSPTASNYSPQAINETIPTSPLQQNESIDKILDNHIENLSEERVVSIEKMNKRKKEDKSSRKNQLPDRAVEIMNDWFEDHLSNPYPHMVEKENLAKLGGISVKQVNAWFSNRRNRSQNTKPKRIKRELETELNNIVDELINNPNKEQVINKIKNTLSF